MKYDPDRHHRRSIRLKGFDYSTANVFYVTVCIQNRLCLFGEVAEGSMRLNPAGEMVLHWWHELNRKFPTATLDEFIVMPNHIHGIIALNKPGTDTQIGPGSGGVPEIEGIHAGVSQSDERPSLPQVMGWFKTMTTNAYLRGIKKDGWPAFDQRLWQRTYWDRVVRDDGELNRIREYVQNNPANWASDEENLKSGGGF